MGMDTRPSGPGLSRALRAGLEREGLEPVDLGVIPSGGISHLTASSAAVMGVVISASHNPAPYNGIKLLGSDGAKLSDDNEAEISRTIEPWDEEDALGAGDDADRRRWAEGVDAYVGWLRGSISADVSGLPVTLDCANGAAVAVGPRVLRELGVDVQTTGDELDGSRINQECGATHPQWVASRAAGRIGLALDGDADRLIAVDENGLVVDGDFLMAILARYLHESGRLRPPLVVAISGSSWRWPPRGSRFPSPRSGTGMSARRWSPGEPCSGVSSQDTSSSATWQSREMGCSPPSNSWR